MSCSLKNATSLVLVLTTTGDMVERNALSLPRAKRQWGLAGVDDVNDSSLVNEGEGSLCAELSFVRGKFLSGSVWHPVETWCLSWMWACSASAVENSALNKTSDNRSSTTYWNWRYCWLVTKTFTPVQRVAFRHLSFSYLA